MRRAIGEDLQSKAGRVITFAGTALSLPWTDASLFLMSQMERIHGCVEMRLRKLILLICQKQTIHKN